MHEHGGHDVNPLWAYANQGGRTGHDKAPTDADQVNACRMHHTIQFAINKICRSYDVIC